MSKTKRHLRACPAVGKEITSQECGENRASKYACPAACPHNPWSPSNYDLVLDLNQRLTGKLMERIRRERRDDDAWLRRAEKAIDDTPDRVTAFWRWQFFGERDAAGRTFYERWAGEDFRGLTNDERVLLRCQAGMRTAVPEVQRIIDEGALEAVDLLGDPSARLTVRDRGLAALAVRFSTYLMPLVTLPHYHSLHGGGTAVPEVADFAPAEVVIEFARHLGAPDEAEALQPWLTGNYARMADAFAALGVAFQQRMMEQIDAKSFRTTYRLRGSAAACLRKLEARDDVVPDDLSEEERAAGGTAAFAWLENRPPADDAQLELPALSPVTAGIGLTTLGRVILGAREIALETTTAARQQPLRARFEKAMAGLVEFSGERVEDLAAQMRSKRAQPFDPALVPPRLLANAPRLTLSTSISPPPPAGASRAEVESDMHRAHLRFWLDQALPALDGRPPRQAAAEAALRPKLLLLVKPMIRRTDLRNRQTGTDDDVNWLLDELGLHEIIFPPPPLRPSSPEDDDAELDEEEWVALLAEETAEAKLPDPPAHPLGEKEVELRLKRLARAFPDDEALINAVFDEAADLLDLMAKLTQDALTREEQGILVAALAEAHFLICPPGTDRGDVNGVRLERRFQRELADMERALQTSASDSLDPLRHWLENSRQPLIAQVACDSIFAAMDAPQSTGFRPERTPLMIAFLKAAVDELDCLAAD